MSFYEEAKLTGITAHKGEKTHDQDENWDLHYCTGWMDEWMNVFV